MKIWSRLRLWGGLSRSLSCSRLYLVLPGRKSSRIAHTNMSHYGFTERNTHRPPAPPVRARPSQHYILQTQTDDAREMANWSPCFRHAYTCLPSSVVCILHLPPMASNLYVVSYSCQSVSVSQSARTSRRGHCLLPAADAYSDAHIETTILGQGNGDGHRFCARARISSRRHVALRRSQSCRYLLHPS